MDKILKEDLIHNINEICNKKNYTFIEFINEKVNTKSKFTVKCNLDNHIWTPSYNNFISKNSGCPVCGDTLLRSEESALLIIIEICNNKNYTFISFEGKKYKGASTKMKLKCNHCYTEWSPKYCNFVHNKSGCPTCKKSKGELEITKFLEDNSIAFIPQKRFKECIDKRPLPFDFYLPDLNLCIEYDGSQHYISKDIWGGLDNLNTIINHDNIKNNYCNINNIKLLRINYNQDILRILNEALVNIK